jgi:hypothetical protein
MAGNFRIDVVVSGGAATGNGSSIPASAAAAAAIAGGFSLNTSGKQFVANLTGQLAEEISAQEPGGTFNGVYDKKSGVYNYSANYSRGQDDYDVTGKIDIKNAVYNRGLFGMKNARVTAFMEKEKVQNDSFYSLEKSPYQGVLSDDPIAAQNRTQFLQRSKALSSAILAKTVYATIQYAQHTSGDSYYNQQLSNMMKLGGYGILLANSGPAAPFVAAGIVVNEGIQAVLDFSKFQFDRKMEAYEITNNLIIAGNASYGRMRGVGV